MNRIVIIFISTCFTFFGTILWVFADEIWQAQTAIQALWTEASGVVSGDPVFIATETIKETAETFPDSPGANAAKRISSSQKPSHSSFLEVLKTYFGYGSIFFLVSTLLLFFVGGYLFNGVQAASSPLKRFIQKLTIFLGILAISSLILYFCIAFIFI